MKEIDKEELIWIIIIVILSILCIVRLLDDSTNADNYPEKQQIEHVRPQPHHKPAQSYKYGYDPIHHKFRWHWE